MVLFTWGAVALVLVAVIGLVIVKIVSATRSTAPSGPQPQPLPAAVAQQITHVPLSVFDAVRVDSPTAAVTRPVAVGSQVTLEYRGKPGIFFLGDEFCPYCAAERWALAVALSRFGTLTGLRTMQSSSTDVFPSTQTLTFSAATFTSRYVAFTARELYSADQDSTGTGYAELQHLTAGQSTLVKRYDATAARGDGTGTGPLLPFVDIGNEFVVSGASFSPSVLQGSSRSEIAADLDNPGDQVTQAIIASANELSAAICAVDGQQPARVCTSSGVTTAAAALGRGRGAGG